MSKNAFLYVVLLITTLIKLTCGNIFTDPTKLARLFELQMRLSKLLPEISNEELAIVPQEIFLGIVR